MKIVTEQTLIFSKVMDNGQLCIVEPGGQYSLVYLLPPKTETTIPVSELKPDTKYNFVLGVVVNIKSEKVKAGDETKYLNKVNFYINDIKEFKEIAEL